MYVSGIGGYTQQDALDCSNATGSFFGALDAAFFMPKCWAMSPSAWEQAAQFKTIAAPVAVAAPTTDQITATYSDPSALSSELISAATTATQTQNAANMQTQLSVAPTNCTGGTENADGTWTCPTSTNWLMWGAIAAGSIVVLVLLKGGR